MSGNSFGKLFTVTTFGESHGTALGCIVDGCPPGLELSEADLQNDLDRRKPGKSRHETQRREPDQVKILSGIFEGKNSARPMQIMPITTNMVSVITVVVADHQHVKPQCEWPLVVLPKNFLNNVMVSKFRGI